MLLDLNGVHPRACGLDVTLESASLPVATRHALVILRTGVKSVPFERRKGIQEMERMVRCM